MPLPITAFVAAACALLLLVTAILTVRARLAAKVAFGDGGDDAITRASRSHGNLAEHAPVVIILFALLESVQAHHWTLLVLGALFLVGRVAHIIGLHTPSPPGKAPLGRQIGVVTTWATMLVLSGWVLVLLAQRNL
jgi:uncharacterized protein